MFLMSLPRGGILDIGRLRLYLDAPPCWSSGINPPPRSPGVNRWECGLCLVPIASTIWQVRPSSHPNSTPPSLSANPEYVLWSQARSSRGFPLAVQERAHPVRRVPEVVSGQARGQVSDVQRSSRGDPHARSRKGWSISTTPSSLCCPVHLRSWLPATDSPWRRGMSRSRASGRKRWCLLVTHGSPREAEPVDVDKIPPDQDSLRGRHRAPQAPASLCAACPTRVEGRRCLLPGARQSRSRPCLPTCPPLVCLSQQSNTAGCCSSASRALSRAARRQALRLGQPVCALCSARGSAESGSASSPLLLGNSYPVLSTLSRTCFPTRLSRESRGPGWGLWPVWKTSHNPPHGKPGLRRHPVRGRSAPSNATS